MKKLFKYSLSIFIFLFFIMFCNNKVEAKSSTNAQIEVTVGDSSLPIYYSVIVESGSSTYNERMSFPVTVQTSGDATKEYAWQHTFCYKITGSNEECETDLMNGENNTTSISGNTSYSSNFYDEDMPYYSEDLTFEYVTFKNQFTCLNCLGSEVITLNDITFTSSEINYKYTFSASLKTFNEYHSNKATLYNYNESSYIINDSSKYRLNTKVCLGKNGIVVSEKCIENDYTTVSSGYSITPYLGNITFTYDTSNLLKQRTDEESIYYYANIYCNSNCDGRRAVSDQSLIVYQSGISYLDVEGPEISAFGIYESIEDIVYSNSNSFTLNINDVNYGFWNSSSYYQRGTYSNGTCYNFSNITVIKNGNTVDLTSSTSEGINCLKIYSIDSLENSTTKIYYFGVDTTGPSVSMDTEYDTSKYYNEINFKLNISDTYSSVGDTYYLWSEEIVNDKDTILNNGVKYVDGITSGSLTDGSYYLNVLSYDSLGNYFIGNSALINMDFTSLIKEEVTIDNKLTGGNYASGGYLTLKVDEIASSKKIKYLFSNKDSVTIDEFIDEISNGGQINLPSEVEETYNLYIYCEDKAGNIGIVKLMDNLNVDTKSPSINTSILYNDDEYRVSNEIVVTVSDFNEIKASELKYGWFLKTKNVTSSNLVETFTNGDTINYPSEYYGEYKLYLKAMDVYGNETFISLDKIFKIDTDIVKLELIGEEEITIIKGETYVDSGAVAYKGVYSSSKRVSDITIEDEVNTNKVGTYYITYSSGEGNYKVSITRKVNVISVKNYNYALVGLFIVGTIIISYRLFKKRKFNDNI